MPRYEIARENMVEGQIRPNKVTDPDIIEAMMELPREKFVPENLSGIAYVDEDISLGNGRYLGEPVVLARLIQEAGVQSGDVVLDIGGATGYSSALLGRLAATVVAVEQDKELAAVAEKTLQELDITNVAVLVGKHAEGCPGQGPFNVILINGSVAEVPREITDQLADGGRLVTVLSKNGRMGRAVVYRRFGDTVSHRVLFDAATPQLPGFESQEGFQF